MGEIEIIGIVAVIILLLGIAATKKKDEEGRITDKHVDVDEVLEHLKEFKVKRNPKLKDGYTEKHIQNQLLVYLREHFVSVTEEYGLEGVNATKIDFDIGKGEVGLEIKIAKSLFKTSSLHRLMGQMDDYIKYKYDDQNLIVAVFGEKEHTSDRVMLERIKSKVEEKKATFIYVEIPSTRKAKKK